jgi:hypothetical protein
MAMGWWKFWMVRGGAIAGHSLALTACVKQCERWQQVRKSQLLDLWGVCWGGVLNARACTPTDPVAARAKGTKARMDMLRRFAPQHLASEVLLHTQRISRVLAQHSKSEL